MILKGFVLFSCYLWLSEFVLRWTSCIGFINEATIIIILRTIISSSFILSLFNDICCIAAIYSIRWWINLRFLLIFYIILRESLLTHFLISNYFLSWHILGRNRFIDLSCLPNICSICRSTNFIILLSSIDTQSLSGLGWSIVWYLLDFNLFIMIFIGWYIIFLIFLMLIDIIIIISALYYCICCCIFILLILFRDVICYWWSIITFMSFLLFYIIFIIIIYYSIVIISWTLWLGCV